MANAQRDYHVTVRNAQYQQWQALLTNRTKRRQSGLFLVQGVRPIGVAVERGWPLRAVLTPLGRPLSAWARQLLDRLADPARGERVARFAVDPDLLAELGEKPDAVPELLAVAELPPGGLDRLRPPPDALLLALDRPANPGNLGTLVRAADAFGAHAVIVTGHAADPYDPRAVRASTGSVFAVPVLTAGGVRDVLDRLAAMRGPRVRVVGTDESGEVDIDGYDLTGPVLLAVGNEGRGLSRPWREGCDALVRIPIGAAAGASSLNAATAGAVALYEATRQRRPPAGAGTTHGSASVPDGGSAEGPR